jgi:hypothetical protein
MFVKMSYFYWTHLSRFHLKMETQPSLRNAVSYIKDRTTDSVQNCDNYSNNRIYTGRGKRVFHAPQSSALGPTQPLIQW